MSAAEPSPSESTHPEFDSRLELDSELYKETPLTEKSVEAPPHGPSYRQFEHRVVALRLRSAKATGQLGSGQPESNPADYSSLLAVLQTIPYRILVFQLVWSTLVTLVAYGLAPREDSSISWFSVEFWTSRLVVSSSVSYGVGWALFVLLGFFIREASNRYWEAQLNWTQMTGNLRQTVRHLRQNYPAGTWHDKDIDRIVAHLIAYPIALKMLLRGEKEREQLQGILHEDDIDDVLNSDAMHWYCMRVVRTYLSASEDDQAHSFDCAAAEKTPAGWGVRYVIMDVIDAVDMSANAIVKIANSSPSAGYVTHLHIFLYIWLFFLPLALVQSSGWFTILWAVLTSYGVGMLFTIGQALTDPFGYDMQDVKLNHLAADTALQVLNAFARDPLELTTVVQKNHDTPFWLEKPVGGSTEDPIKPPKGPGLLKRLIINRIANIGKGVFLYVLVVVVWSAFLLFLTWGRRTDETTCRWWCIYIPVDSSITSYVSLGIFLILGFWMNVAYSRYWRALQLWQSKIRTCIEELAFQFAVMCKPGTWHDRDRERLFSHVVALCYAAKFKLRGSRDTSELNEFLSPQDVTAFDESDDFFVHATDVVFGYLNSVDSAHESATQVSTCPLNFTIYTLGYTLWGLEWTIQECAAIHQFPISPSFTTHLKVFTFFWLALLPLSLISFSGFLSFLYIIPISYSIINLIKIGSNLADPFGFDKEDIPLDVLCDEIKTSVHNLYHETKGGMVSYVRPSTYSREMFRARQLSADPVTCNVEELKEPTALWRRWFRKSNSSHDQSTHPTVVGSLRSLFDKMPSVSLRYMILVIVWTIMAVFLSYGLSFSWSDEKRDQCLWWCSPIDVDVSVLANIGFALFMILSFRASDAIGRYEEGAMLVYDIEMNLRNLAIEIVQNFRDGFFHEKDKERIVAHIVQIPLCFRDRLLGIERKEADEKEGLLSDEDRHAFESSAYPIEHLLQTVEGYLLLQDSPSREYPHISDDRINGALNGTMLSRIAATRTTISRALGVKRFPVIESYTQHQHMFTVLWLGLLPLAMAPSTGFFTILWAPIISFGVLGLEEIAARLVDPYGNDAIDIPLEKMCTEAAAGVLGGVQSVEWGLSRHIHPMLSDNNPQLGTVLQKRSVGNEYTLPHFDDSQESSMFGDGTPVRFSGPKSPKMKPGFYAHVMRSVPWWLLLYVTVWTTIGTIISYAARKRGDDVVARWWQSNFSVNSTVATYISFAAFMLLGFFVRSAFVRYISAGSVWGARLRSSCHALATQFQVLFEEGTFHDGDHRRIIAHVAAIPLVLKAELRNSRDIREIKGLLSFEDVARIQCADSMVSHCVDVLRSYFLGVQSDNAAKHKPFHFGSRVSFVKYEIIELEKMIRESKFLRSFEIAPGFLILLNTFLGLWFLILPFAIAEHSGWFTILWIPIIAYGVLGMYSIAKELQFPFGTDLNDLDLDTMADEIVADLLFVQKHLTRNSEKFVRASSIEPFWTERSDNGQKPVNKGFKERMRENLKLALNTFSLWQTTVILIWTALCVLAAWLVSREFPFSDEIEEGCSMWFCSRIAVSGEVKEYVGFALFLLLGFRLYESHGRYMQGIGIWSQIKGILHLLSNRIFECYYGGEWHEQDVERVAAHLAAFAVTIMGKLRGEDCEDRLRKILSEEDCDQLLRAHDRSDYCLDVLHYYLSEGDRWSAYKEKSHAGCNEHWIFFWYLKDLRFKAVDLEEIVNIPMPYGYVQHLRIFLFIWLLLLPLGFVESSGWLAILWIGFISYGIVGIEKWSSELANPFGKDLSDVPLEEIVDEICDVVKQNLMLYKDGVQPFIRQERNSFPHVMESE
ncbi:hypothetical protein BWQ96_08484 [Gracilariopsis chorda]|uniref:Uncharacterized protein n=1 Tax=Gracilariopsis chorda TaxID=448386 RepID=A0A2V3IKY2_9FLOR|nr:hypothetical protein BWQ96_08484 [Gracilariopsis chorda]|eukprot:PXF41790.1 hypothetical protein BWQ96_08484 [Gracilariopsis chorda]